jgi:hypothetical protein
MSATNKYIPGKRLKTWHRRYRKSLGVSSLRQFVRNIIATPVSDSRSEMERKTALEWAGGKVAP